MEGISRRELARREGIAESSVRRHIESGALAAAVLPDGSLDAEKASAALAAVVTNAKRVPVALTHARGRRLRVQVRAREDEVADLQVSAVPPEVAATLLREQAAIITRHARPLAEAAAKLAGLTAAAALPKLKDLVNGALEAIGEDDGGEDDGDEWWNEREEPPIDLDHLPPNMLLARKIDLQSTKLEFEHGLARGDLRDIGEVTAAFEGRAAVAK